MLVGLLVGRSGRWFKLGGCLATDLAVNTTKALLRQLMKICSLSSFSQSSRSCITIWRGTSKTSSSLNKTAFDLVLIESRSVELGIMLVDLGLRSQGAGLRPSEECSMESRCQSPNSPSPATD